MSGILSTIWHSVKMGAAHLGAFDAMGADYCTPNDCPPLGRLGFDDLCHQWRPHGWVSLNPDHSPVYRWPTKGSVESGAIIFLPERSAQLSDWRPSMSEQSSAGCSR